jgi:hypothetical protein
MAFDVSALTDYVEQNESDLITRSLFLSKTSDLIRSQGNVMTGVKNAETINELATDAIFQDGSGCSRTSSGTTSLTQRTVTVGKIAVVEDICVDDLEKKYLSKKLAKGSGLQDIPFEKEYTDLKTGTIAEQLETAIWQGDTASSNTNLKRFDGFIKLIDNAGSAVLANTAAFVVGGQVTISGGGITASNVRAIVSAMWKSLPARVTGKGDIRVFCGWDIFNLYIDSYTEKNLFNFAPTGSEVKAENGEVTIPGTTYKLTAVHGLDGTNRLYALRMSNMYAGTDLEDEWEKWTIMPDQFKDYLRFKARFKYGVNVAYPDEISTFKLVA